MKIMITGAKGQVGCELVQLCEERGLNYVAFDSKGLDITDEQAVMACVKREQPNVIINAAAYTAVDKAEDDREAAFAVNAEGPKYLALAVKAVNAKLIHISTDYVFDGEKETPYTVDDIPNPKNVYGESKLAGEELIARHLRDYLIVRVSWVFGEFGNNFVKTMLKLAETRDEISVVSDQWGGPCPASLIADFILSPRVLNKLTGLFHFSTQPKLSRAEFAETIFACAGSSMEIIPVTSESFGTRAMRPKNTTMTSGEAEPSWREELEKLINAYLTNC